MSSFSLQNADPECKVHLPNDLSKDQLLSFRAFKDWLSTLQKSLAAQKSADHAFHSAPYRLRRIDVQCVDFFGGSRVGFVKLKADVSTDDGESLPGSVFLRGGSVAMLLTLQPDDAAEGSEDEKQVILAVQPRIPAGSLALAELPAGMLDDAGTFAGGAAKEIEEETGMKVEEKDLLDMTQLAFPEEDPLGTGEALQRAMYPSPGGSDEYIPLFLHQRRVPRAQLSEWQGKLTGLREHGEKITLRLVKLTDLWRERDGKTLAAYALYEGLRREGKI